MDRRGFLKLGMQGILVACAAPAIVRAASLMPVRTPRPMFVGVDWAAAGEDRTVIGFVIRSGVGNELSEATPLCFADVAVFGPGEATWVDVPIIGKEQPVRLRVRDTPIERRFAFDQSRPVFPGDFVALDRLGRVVPAAPGTAVGQQIIRPFE